MGNIGKIVVDNLWIIVAIAVALLVYRSNPRQRIAVLLALLVPGLGHWWIKEKRRGLVFAGITVGLFLTGMVLAGFANVSPFDRHPIWGMAQIPGGLLTLVAALATSGVKIIEQSNLYTMGCLYTGVGCLINILAACDVWDLTMNAEQENELKVRNS